MMTDEQKRAAEALAHDHICFGRTRMTKDQEEIDAFNWGYQSSLEPDSIALMSPEQLLHNPHVKALVEALEATISLVDNTSNLSQSTVDTLVKQYKKALAPFKGEK